MREIDVIRAEVRALVAEPFPVGQFARLSPGIGAGWLASSDDTLCTGRDAIFVPFECVLGGAR